MAQDHRAAIFACLREEAVRRDADAVAFLRDLVRTPSVSGDEGDHVDPATVAGRLWHSFADTGIERHAQQVWPGRDNVVALLRGRPDGPVVVLDAHTDTVPPGAPEQWHNHDPHSAADGTVTYLGNNRLRLEIGDRVVEREVRPRLGRLWEARSYASAPVVYGRGSFDNKGPVVVAWHATRLLATCLARCGLRLGGTLATGFTVDEEQEMAGTRAFAGGPGSWLDQHGLLPSAIGPDGYRVGITGVALDGSYGFVPVVGHRGVAQLALRTSGQAAHAATPGLGVNAVTRMAALLDALDRDPAALVAHLSPLFRDEVLEPVSVAVGTTIAGGGVRGVRRDGDRPEVDRGAVNVVPDWCEATLDCRHPRPADGDQSAIQRRIADAVLSFALERTGLPGDAAEMTLLGGSPPCAIVDALADGVDDPLVGAVLRHGEACSGFAPWIETAPGGTDASVMINSGQIKTLVEFGPAGAFAHEPHEFVERDQMRVGAEILARTIVDLLGVEPA